VNYRWYGDLTTEPNEKQVNLSRSAIDAGADLVVGYHPQQLQGAEVYNSRPIVYSLGDFIFHDAPLEDHDTATLRVSLRDKQMKVEFLPVSVRDARPQAASGETAEAILTQIRQSSEGLPSPLRFPVILDAAFQKSPLLKPKKPTAPVKTLGELEPGLPDNSAHSDAPTEYPIYDEYPTYLNEDLPGPESFSPEPSETFPKLESFEQITVEELTPEPASLDSQNTLENIPRVVSPLDSFNTQPDNPDIDGGWPHESGESIKPVEPIPEPKVNNGLNNDLDADAGPELFPEQGEDILLPTEQPLPGYDALEHWGEKASPHQEFSPIQEHLESFEPSDLKPSVSLPAVSSEMNHDLSVDEAAQEEAISPHDEPLVGPLS
jgi:poly-gamma-glutamate synthesis protein (capsule biosynthesis protein)